MSAHHGSLAAHHPAPQSLPSFAQAFSSHSLSAIPGNNSLPPIQSRLSPMDNRRVNTPSAQPSSRPASEEHSDSKTAGRKRPHKDITSNTRDDHPSDSDRASPTNLVHVKEEQDQDMLDPTPSPDRQLDTGGAPPPSSLLPSPLKKRRVTVSGAPHPLNTDVRAPADQTNSTPISPVVMGFTIHRDNPNAIEQVRSMISVKHKQKALIEQRRGSAAGLVAASGGVGGTPPVPADERSYATGGRGGPPPPPSAATRSTRRSPNTNTGARRSANPQPQSGGSGRPPSPSPVMVPSQQPLPHVPGGQPQPTHTLPPVPISFARRRAGLLGGKKKPADIVISPREAHTPDQLAPAIQSAPPVPHAGQSSFYSGRFAMALPRLPSAMGGGDSVRRVASNVPPTPTRLSMLGGAAPSTTVAGISGRSPPAASVPISSVRVPPTPASLHHPSYSNDKSAFLAPFEVFYDALNDSKQLKTWLGEQLQRSNMIVQSLTQQQEKLGETVEALVEKKMAPVRSEVTSLRRRVEELEDALRVATYDRRHSIDNTLGALSKGKQPLRNGIPPGPVTPETYTFPPVPPSDSRQARPELIRRQSSPGWPQQQQQEREARGNQHMTDSDTGSPAPYESRRQSVSASRLEPHPIPRSHSHTSSEMPHPRGPIVQVQSPPQVYRESANHALPPPSSVNSSHSAKTRGGAHERPSLSRQTSYTNAPPAGGESDSPIPRHADSRRSSIAPEES